MGSWSAYFAANNTVLQRDHFVCSNGETFDVLRKVTQEIGLEPYTGRWELFGMCTSGILSKKHYDVNFSNSELRECSTDFGERLHLRFDGDQVQDCASEFLEHNSKSGLIGYGLIVPKIKHGKHDSKSFWVKGDNGSNVLKE